MSTNDAMSLTRIKALPIRARAAVALAVAEMVVLELAEDPEGLKVAQEALCLSWRWVSGAPVTGEEIDEYISSHTDKNLTRYELRYQKEATRAAISTISCAAAFVGREAYEVEGVAVDMLSESMGQVSDEDFDAVLHFAKETSRYNEEAIQRLADFFCEHYAGQGPETLGDLITVDDILPLISGVPSAR